MKNIIAASLTLLPLVMTGRTYAADLDATVKSGVVMLEGPSGGGSGMIVGKQGNRYTLLTAKHVVGAEGDETDIVFADSSRARLTITKRFQNSDAAVGTFSTTQPLALFAINAFLPYPAPGTAEHMTELNLRSRFNTVTTRGLVAGYSLPSKAIKARVFRVISMQLVDKISGNTNGYNLLYQASTVQGMSGGPVLAFRDCNISGGFALGFSPKQVFPVLVGIHGMSEDYTGGEGRSGISLGIPLDGDVMNYIKSIAPSSGIPVGETAIREAINHHFCPT